MKGKVTRIFAGCKECGKPDSAHCGDGATPVTYKLGHKFISKGFAFLIDENGEARFIHISDNPNFGALKIDDVVEFEPLDNKRGLRAGKIKLCL